MLWSFIIHEEIGKRVNKLKVRSFFLKPRDLFLFNFFYWLSGAAANINTTIGTRETFTCGGGFLVLNLLFFLCNFLTPILLFTSVLFLFFFLSMRLWLCLPTARTKSHILACCLVFMRVKCLNRVRLSWFAIVYAFCDANKTAPLTEKFISMMTAMQKIKKAQSKVFCLHLQFHIIA